MILSQFIDMMAILWLLECLGLYETKYEDNEVSCEKFTLVSFRKKKYYNCNFSKFEINPIIK